MTTQRARALRKNPTDAERLLWGHLRLRQMEGYKFRRQQSISPYIVDFVCLEQRLIVEVDGGQHIGSAGDAARDHWLASRGFRVLRFSNHQVLKEAEAVKQAISAALLTLHPPPESSPSRGEENQTRKQSNSRQPKMLRVLFVCVHNAGRSRMAAAFANHLGKGVVVARSAGTVPAERVNPVVVEAMWEKGIDVSQERPKLLTQEMVAWADRVITMGCGADEACPVTFVPAEDWGLDDPAGQPLEAVRRIRDEIEARVRELVTEVQSFPRSRR